MTLGVTTTTIRTSTPLIGTVTWEGMGETEDDTYELMSLTLDGVKVGEAHAPGGKLGCAGGMAPVVSSPPPPQRFALSPDVDHQLVIHATTNDEKYHSGAYYQFKLSFAPAP